MRSVSQNAPSSSKSNADRMALQAYLHNPYTLFTPPLQCPPILPQGEQITHKTNEKGRQ